MFAAQLQLAALESIRINAGPGIAAIARKSGSLRGRRKVKGQAEMFDG